MYLKKPEPPEDFPDFAQLIKGKDSPKAYTEKLLAWYSTPEAALYRLKLAHYAEHAEAKNLEHLLERIEDLKKRGYAIDLKRLPLDKGGMCSLVLITKADYCVSLSFPDFLEPSVINQNLRELLSTLDLIITKKQNIKSDDDPVT